MEPKWLLRPVSLNYIPKGTGKIIAVDETGTSNLKPVQKAIMRGIEPDTSEKTFTVTACMLDFQDYLESLESIYNLKCKYWKDGFFDYGNNEIRRVCLHSREIRRKEGPFHPGIIDYPAFVEELSETIRKIPMTLFASHINKVEHVRQHSNPESPYCLCLDFILERIVLSNTTKQTCVIALESRGKKEDRFLLEHLRGVLQNGTNGLSSQCFSCITGVYFNPKWSVDDSKKTTPWQLELADLCAYPIYRHCVSDSTTKNRAFEAVENKLYHYPDYKGYGLITFP